jgi:thiol-disulfide isomerase/thioredoxin
MRTPNWICAIVSTLALTVATTLSTAQMADQILQQASGALIEAGTLRATLTIHGEGADMFKSAMPVGEVVFLLRHDPAQGDTPAGWTTRITGSTTTGSAKNKEPVKLDILRSPKLMRWVDHDKKKVFETLPERALATRSTGYTAARSLILSELLTPVPFKREIEAEELAVLDTAEVDGVVCDVVEVTYPKPTGRTRAAATHQVARFSIGQKDRLIRRIERVSGSGAMSMVIVLELTTIEPGAKLTDEDFEIPLPQGYELTQSSAPSPVTATAKGTAKRVEGVGAPAKVAQKPEEPTDTFDPAPAFAASLSTGETLSIETLAGTPAVLYFWGTWSMESRPYSPLVSELADDYRDRGVRVIGLAVRERDPENAVTVARVRDYTFEVATGGIDAADAFGVVVYPTFAIIDATGHLVGTERVRRGAKPDEVLARVRTLIDKALELDKPAIEPNDEEPASDDQP